MDPAQPPSFSHFNPCVFQQVRVAIAALEDAALHGEHGVERTFLLRSLCKALGVHPHPSLVANSQLHTV
jgi:hypothetical protein